MVDEKCAACGSGDIVRGIRVGMTAEVGHIGLSYQTAILIKGTEPMVADLCTGCGVIARLRVQNTDRKWQITGK